MLAACGFQGTDSPEADSDRAESAAQPGSDGYDDARTASQTANGAREWRSRRLGGTVATLALTSRMRTGSHGHQPRDHW